MVLHLLARRCSRWCSRPTTRCRRARRLHSPSPSSRRCGSRPATRTASRGRCSARSTRSRRTSGGTSVPASAGAVGWMQFMPDTWLRWGLDASGDGIADPWDPYDAVYAAARYLAAGRREHGICAAVSTPTTTRTDHGRGARAGAALYARGGVDVGFGVGSLDAQNAAADVSETAAQLAAAVADERRLAAIEAHLRHRVAPRAPLRPPHRPQACGAGRSPSRRGGRRGRAAPRCARDRASASSAPPFATTYGTTGIVLSPETGRYVFPVGGGASAVDVAHTHHDYPAADIAAPAGSPIFAHTDEVVVAAWPTPSGRCGIGVQTQTADGVSWVYCATLPILGPPFARAPGCPRERSSGAVGSTGHTASRAASTSSSSRPWPTPRTSPGSRASPGRRSAGRAKREPPAAPSAPWPRRGRCSRSPTTRSSPSPASHLRPFPGVLPSRSEADPPGMASHATPVVRRVLALGAVALVSAVGTSLAAGGGLRRPLLRADADSVQARVPRRPGRSRTGPRVRQGRA